MKTFKPALWLFLLLFLIAEAKSQDFKFLRVDNIRPGNNGLNLGYNTDSYTGPPVDVTAGGNTHMSITFRLPEDIPSFIQIRPNESSTAVVSLEDYLPAGFESSYDWTTVHIPLADFGAADFQNLYVLQIPYSQSGVPYVFDLKRLEFTGGSTPYVWYGHENRGNKHNGLGGEGMLVADEQSDLYLSAKLEYSKAISPYNGQASLIAIYKNHFDQEAYDHLWNWSDGYTGRVRTQLAPGKYQVVFGPLDNAYDTLTFTLHSQGPLSPEISFTSPSGTNAGRLVATLDDGLPTYYNDDRLITFDTATQEQLNHGFFSITNGYNFPMEMDQDHAGNYYEINTYSNQTEKLLVKKNSAYQAEWARLANYIFKDQQLFTDDLGRSLVFTRLRNPKYSYYQTVINGRWYNSYNEAYAFVMYNKEGEIEWVKVLDDLLFSVQVRSVVSDDQGRLVCLFTKNDHKGTQTIMVVMGKNGNELQRVYSQNYYGNPNGGYSLVITENNETYLYAPQREGTIFTSGVPLPYTSQFLTRFDEDMNVIYEKGIFTGYYTHKTLDYRRERLLVRNDYYLTRVTQGGNEIWHLRFGPFVQTTLLGNGDSYIYIKDNATNDLLIYNYDKVLMGRIPLPDTQALFLIKEDVQNNVHLKLLGGELGYGTTVHAKLSLEALDTVTIPAGSNSFAYSVRDTIGNTYQFNANFVASEVEDEVLNGDMAISTRSLISIYPNPSTSDIIFSYSQGHSANRLTLTDLNGRIIHSWQNIPVSDFTVPRQGLSPGMYLLTFEDEAGSTTERIVFK